MTLQESFTLNLTEDRSGADVVGEMVAALTIGSMVFKQEGMHSFFSMVRVHCLSYFYVFHIIKMRLFQMNLTGEITYGDKNKSILCKRAET